MKRLLLLVFLLALSGCGKRQDLIFDQPAVPAGGRYEPAWINPELIAADSLITLIRSDEIDSIFVARPPMAGRVTPSVIFLITQTNCSVRAELLDGQSQFVLPLLLQDLPSGYYKLTFQVDRFTEAEYSSANHYLRVVTCEGEYREALVSD